MGLGNDVLTVVGVNETIVDSYLSIYINIGDRFITSIALIGFFCYLYDKRIMKQSFWKVYAPLFLLWHIGYRIYSLFFASEMNTQALTSGATYTIGLLISGIILTLFMFPLFASLFKYAYKEPSIKEVNHQNPQPKHNPKKKKKKRKK